jgi:hypothetical protein
VDHGSPAVAVRGGGGRGGRGGAGGALTGDGAAAMKTCGGGELRRKRGGKEDAVGCDNVR